MISIFPCFNFHFDAEFIRTANKTKEALEALLECEFMHSIDAPSLSLLVPLLSRALKERTADLKRKGSAITGNIMSMIGEPKALLPYLATLLPGLQGCIIDPIPDVRATAAKALGTLLVGLGEDEAEMSQIMPWLMSTLTSEVSSVERSGAAQGLAELCCAANTLPSSTSSAIKTANTSRLEEVLTLTLPLRQSNRSAAREVKIFDCVCSIIKVVSFRGCCGCCHFFLLLLVQLLVPAFQPPFLSYWLGLVTKMKEFEK